MMRWPWISRRKLDALVRALEEESASFSGPGPRPDTDDPARLAYTAGERLGLKAGIEHATGFVRYVRDQRR